MTSRDRIIDKRGLLEGARWHEGALYVSDIDLGEVLRVDGSGGVSVLAHVPRSPSGLGWRPDGTMLIASMGDCTLLSWDESAGLQPVADLAAHAAYEINDMTVDGAGRAFIGQPGFDRQAGLVDVGADLLRVDPDNSVHVAAADLHVANGMAITDDGSTLIVAESLGRRLTAFTLDSDGILRDRRVWAALPSVPDGLCLDARGNVWVALPHEKVFRLVSEGGEVLSELPVDCKAVTCALGGSDGRDLFLSCTETFLHAESIANPSAYIEVVRVDTPAATGPSPVAQG